MARPNHREYTLLTHHHASSSFLLSFSRPRRIVMLFSLTLLLLVFYFYRIPYTQGRSSQHSTRSYWAQYSPYAPVEAYRRLPQSCQVIQVNIVRSFSLVCLSL